MLHKFPVALKHCFLKKMCKFSESKNELKSLKFILVQSLHLQMYGSYLYYEVQINGICGRTFGI